MNTRQSEQGYFSKDKAEIYTSLSKRTLEYALADGKLRAFKVGKRVVFAKDDLDRFVRQKQLGADLDSLVDETMRELRT